MSEAAKPADPERALAPDREAALAELERRHADRLRLHSPEARRLTEIRAAVALGWLLPLARAGLRAQQNASHAEFVAVVRELSRLIDARYENRTEAAVVALRGPLAAAVLRAPEPTAATESPADGGA